MNKMLMMTLAVCVIIVGMIFSASLISGTNSANIDAQETASNFDSISDSQAKGGLSDVRSGIVTLSNELTNVSQRVDNLEQMHRQLAEQVVNDLNSLNSSGGQITTSNGSQDLKCTVNNYLDEQYRPVPPADINYATLNSELATGQKKIQMTCSF